MVLLKKSFYFLALFFTFFFHMEGFCEAFYELDDSNIGKIHGLVLVSVEPHPTQVSALLIKGKFYKKNHNLLFQDQIVAVGSDSGFEIHLEKVGEKTPIDFFSIAPSGKTERARFIIDKKSQNYFASVDENQKKNFYFTPSLAWGSISIKADQYFYANENAMTVFLGARKIFSQSRWDLDGNIFYNFLVYNLSGNSKSGIQFLSANLRVGYLLPWLRSPWSLRLATGGYFSKGISENPFFDYSIAYLQLYPVLNYQLNSDLNLITYLKFVPTGKKFLNFSVDKREVAIGFGFSYKFFEKTPVTILLNYSDLRFDRPLSTGSIEYNVRSWTLNLGTSF